MSLMYFFYQYIAPLTQFCPELNLYIAKHQLFVPSLSAWLFATKIQIFSTSIASAVFKFITFEEVIEKKLWLILIFHFYGK